MSEPVGPHIPSDHQISTSQSETPLPPTQSSEVNQAIENKEVVNKKQQFLIYKLDKYSGGEFSKSVREVISQSDLADQFEIIEVDLDKQVPPRVKGGKLTDEPEFVAWIIANHVRHQIKPDPETGKLETDPDKSPLFSIACNTATQRKINSYLEKMTTGVYDDILLGKADLNNEKIKRLASDPGIRRLKERLKLSDNYDFGQKINQGTHFIPLNPFESAMLYARDAEFVDKYPGNPNAFFAIATDPTAENTSAANKNVSSFTPDFSLYDKDGILITDEEKDKERKRWQTIIEMAKLAEDSDISGATDYVKSFLPSSKNSLSEIEDTVQREKIKEIVNKRNGELLVEGFAFLDRLGVEELLSLCTEIEPEVRKHYDEITSPLKEKIQNPAELVAHYALEFKQTLIDQNIAAIKTYEQLIKRIEAGKSDLNTEEIEKVYENYNQLTKDRRPEKAQVPQINPVSAYITGVTAITTQKNLEDSE